MQCYKLKKEQITKTIRYCAKNKFVFPQFYGSYFLECAKSLWEAIDLMDLETADGIPLKKHLRMQGIKELGDKNSDWETGRIETVRGTFMDHIREVEKDFWGNRFKVYKQWKYDWWHQYLEHGEFEFLTGFVGRGVYNKRQVCNYPIQGSAFHCLLWSLIRLQRWMKKNKMRSKIVAEIHDSLVIYFHVKEIDDVLAKAKQIMTVDIVKYWPWIIVPLTIEAEISEEGQSWAKKKVYPIPA